MQILMLCGSRNRKGRTARAMEAIGQGARKAGAGTESIYLTELAIERCRQCNKDGYGICISKQKCVIKDDFASVVAKIKAADVVVFVSPVYFLDLSESMRAFLERLRRIVPDSARYLPFNRIKHAIPAIGVCLAGKNGGGATNCCLNLEKNIMECGFDVVDMIPLRRQNLEFKLPVLETTGEWLATKPTSGEFIP
jgi:multimeric flavodoxin WrbA